jgi:hypothetical protein
VRLEGWNHVPNGLGAWFDLAAAPWWLRVWFHTPFVDRFAYPILVRRGHGQLSIHPGFTVSQEAITGARAAGWRIV